MDIQSDSRKEASSKESHPKEEASSTQEESHPKEEGSTQKESPSKESCQGKEIDLLLCFKSKMALLRAAYLIKHYWKSIRLRMHDSNFSHSSKNSSKSDLIFPLSFGAKNILHVSYVFT